MLLVMSSQNYEEAQTVVKKKTSAGALAFKLVAGFVFTLIFAALFLNGTGDQPVFGVLFLIPSATTLILGVKQFFDMIEKK